MKLIERNGTMEIVHDVTVHPVRGRVDSVLTGTNLTGGQSLTKITNAVLRCCTPAILNSEISAYFDAKEYKDRIDYRCDAVMRFGKCEADDIFNQTKEVCITFVDINNLLPSYTVSAMDIFSACHAQVDNEEDIYNYAINMLIRFLEDKLGGYEEVHDLFVDESAICNVIVKDAINFRNDICPHNDPVVFENVRKSFYKARTDRDVNYTRSADESLVREKADESAYAEYLKTNKAVTWGDVLQSQTTNSPKCNERKGFFRHRR